MRGGRFKTRGDKTAGLNLPIQRSGKPRRAFPVFLSISRHLPLLHNREAPNTPLDRPGQGLYRDLATVAPGKRFKTSLAQTCENVTGLEFRFGVENLNPQP